MATARSDRQRKRVYIYDLPYAVMRKLCGILDTDKVWEELGGRYLNFDYPDLQRFGTAVYRAESPAYQMLTSYGQRNGTVDHLFVYLYHLNQFQAMDLLLPHVSDKVKHLCKSGRGHTTTMMKGDSKNSGYSEGSFKDSRKFSGFSSSFISGSKIQYSRERYTIGGGSHRSSRKLPEEQNVPSELEYDESLMERSKAEGLDKYNISSANFNRNDPESMKSKDMKLLHSPEYKNIDGKHSNQQSPQQNHYNNPMKTSKVVNTDKQGVQNGHAEPLTNDNEASVKKLNIHDDQVDKSVKLNNIPGKILPINMDSEKISNKHKDDYERNIPPSSHRKSSNENNELVNDIKINGGAENNLKVSTYPKGNVSPKIGKRDTHVDHVRKTSKGSSVLQIQYSEILTATNQFTSKILGQGGFGTVYRGEWKNMNVAIKLIRRNRDKSRKMNGEDPKLQQSFTELRTLDSCRHDNILPLYGYCLNEEGLCLVYQFMGNGSLEDRLQCRNNVKPLDWIQRCEILRGSACGISYLHSLERPLIHGDIKCANILLDKNLEPKIGDFGLVSEGPDPDKTARHVTQIRGTVPYLPPEYLKNHRLSTKVDSFSYGVVLYEVATGAKAYDDMRGRIGLPKMLVEYVKRNHEKNTLEKIRDYKAGNEYSEIFYSLITLGQRCTEDAKDDRPEIFQIIVEFDNLLQKISRSKDGNVHFLKPRKKSNPVNKIVVSDEKAKNIPAVILQKPGNWNQEQQIAQPANEPIQIVPSSKPTGSPTPRPRSPVEQTLPDISDFDIGKVEGCLDAKGKEISPEDMLPPSYNSVVNSPGQYGHFMEERYQRQSNEGVRRSSLENENRQELVEQPSGLLPDLSIFHINGHESSRESKPNNGSGAADGINSSSSNISIHSNAMNDTEDEDKEVEIVEEPSLTAKGKNVMDFGNFAEDDDVLKDMQRLGFK